MGLGAFGGGIVGGATVKLLLDDAQYRAELDRAKAETASSASAMGGSASRFGAAAKAGFAVAGLAAAVFAKDSIEAALQHEQVLAQFQVAMKNAGDATGQTSSALEDQAKSLEKLTGFTEDEILAADTVLARFKLTKDQLLQVTPVVLDYARATGKAVPDAAGAIGKALLGNTRALKSVGIDYTVTGNKATDFANILSLLKTRVGGAAEAFGQTNAGKIEIFKAALHEASIEVGQALVPALQGLLAILRPMLPLVEGAAKNMGLLLGAFLAFKAASFLPSLLQSIGLAAASMNLGSIAAGATEASTALTGLSNPEIAVGIAGAVVAVIALKDAVEGFQGKNTVLVPAGAIEATDNWTRAMVRASGGINDLGDQIDTLFGAVGQVTAILGASGSSADLASGDYFRAADAAKRLADEERGAADEARNLYNAQLSLAGGLLGIQGAALSAAKAQQDLKSADADVNKLQQEGKKNTQDYRDAILQQRQAELGAVQSKLALVNAVQQYVRDNAGSNASTSQAIGLIRQYGREAGLTGGQVRGLIANVLGLVASNSKVPRSVQTTYLANGLAGDLADLARYNQYLAGLNGKHIIVTFETHYIETGARPHGGIQ